ncbi:unnamed protein product [Rotaria sordida]|uniref:ATP receptor n=1 Tax=Rotaria sordida TaxID=392033 RepID=A0A814TLL5_9BILA|nr:unnamed protein product [Rotaria sordida]
MLRSCISNYKIPKVVIIRSIPFTLVCRFVQCIILLYGILYLIFTYPTWYQEVNESIASTVIANIKGIYYNPIEQNQSLIIDNADYIVPSQEKDALFLMTNSIQTVQEYKRCSESFHARQRMCVNDSQCQLKMSLPSNNGKWTGRCLKEIGRCELEGWCPVSDDYITPTPSRDALNFNLFIKNFIEFKRFKLIKTNIAINSSYFKVCNYDPIKDKTCPIFRLGTLLDMIEPDLHEQMNMLQYDRSLDQCIPHYSFRRLDPPFKQAKFSFGYNFRFASHWKHENRSFRTLTKAYGIRFIFSVSFLDTN